MPPSLPDPRLGGGLAFAFENTEGLHVDDAAPSGQSIGSSTVTQTMSSSGSPPSVSSLGSDNEDLSSSSVWALL